MGLQADTGKLLWSYEPEPKLDRAYDKQHSVICDKQHSLIGRGVLDWKVPAPDPDKPCAILALPRACWTGIYRRPWTHAPASFALILPVAALIDLNKMGITGVPASGEVNVTPVPLVFEDLVIVGSAISDNHAMRSRRRWRR